MFYMWQKIYAGCQPKATFLLAHPRLLASFIFMHLWYHQYQYFLQFIVIQLYLAFAEMTPCAYLWPNLPSYFSVFPLSVAITPCAINMFYAKWLISIIYYIFQGAIFCPLICLVVTIGNSVVLLGLWPAHAIWTYYCLARYLLDLYDVCHQFSCFHFLMVFCLLLWISLKAELNCLGHFWRFCCVFSFLFYWFCGQ